MTTAMTVLGPVAAANLGTTLVHEHILCDLGNYWNPDSAPELIAAEVTAEILGDLRVAPFAPYDNLSLRSLAEAAAALSLFADAGGQTMLDVTSHGLHRQPRALRWLSETTGVNIVAGCGYYIADAHPPGLSERAVEAIADEMVRELTTGIDGTGVTAGVIGEIGVGHWPPHPDEATVLRAAALAQASTGRPAVVHCPPDPGSVLLLAQELTDIGFDPGATVLSHLDVRLRDDLEAFSAVGGLGFMLGLDTFGRELYYPERHAQHPSDDVRVALVVALIDRGLEQQVFLSQDICLRHELSSRGGVGYHHVLSRIVPRLLDRGVTQEAIDLILVSNPARILARGTS